MNKMSPKVDGFVRKSKQWQEELQKLRTILLDCPLVEEVKWRHPCYTSEGRNIVIIGAFKESCVLTFVKGSLLKDAKQILVKPGENTQVARVIRFTDVRQIVELAPVLKAYIHEAIEVEKSGVKVKLKKITDYKLPDELQKKFDKTPALKAAFRALTPGRQRAYILYFSAAKQSKTREARIEKFAQKILDGKGIDE
jgi:uncharacterized protein YdeI (YjbR/CyaY-like superfamily)